MALVRSRDHGQVELRGTLPDLIRSPDDLDSGVLPNRLLAALVVPGHNRRQPHSGGRGDERRMEPGAREPVAEKCDLHWPCHAPLSRMAMTRRRSWREPR